MPRPYTTPNTAWPGSDVTNASAETPLLTHQTSYGRAVENEYSDNPSVFRPGSAPPISSVLAMESAHRVIETDTLQRANEGRSRPRHSRPRLDPLRSQRHPVAFPAPDYAIRSYMGTASLPSSIASREAQSHLGPNATFSGAKPQLTNPCLTQPSTVGHYATQRTISEDLSRSTAHRTSPPITPPRLHELRFMFTPTDASSPPPRPPPTGPKADDLRRGHLPDRPRDTTSQLGAGHSTYTPDRRVSSPSVVQSQPKPLSSSRLKSDSISKKSTIVKLKKDETTKTQTAPPPRSGSAKSSMKSDSTLKKDTNREVSSHPDETDHENLNLRSGLAAKPGEHSYNCPRCGKCMCPLCMGDRSGALTDCWLCNNRCLCDVDTCIETVTCLCCIRCCFYHCTTYEDNAYGTDKPCTCRAENCCCRWSVIAGCSLILPCLLCYPVARGCVKLCRHCAACMRPGCRCKESLR